MINLPRYALPFYITLLTSTVGACTSGDTEDGKGDAAQPPAGASTPNGSASMDPDWAFDVHPTGTLAGKVQGEDFRLGQGIAWFVRAPDGTLKLSVTLVRSLDPDRNYSYCRTDGEPRGVVVGDAEFRTATAQHKDFGVALMISASADGSLVLGEGGRVPDDGVSFELESYNLEATEGSAIIDSIEGDVIKGHVDIKRTSEKEFFAKGTFEIRRCPLPPAD